MKTLFFSLMLSVFSLVGMSQTYDVTISGVVTDIDSGEAVEGQMIDIMSDSVNGDFFYFNSVFTDASGYYEDVIAVPDGTTGAFTVSTMSCGAYLSQVAQYSENNTEFEIDFAVCTEVGGGDCQAMFYYETGDPANNLVIQFTDASSGDPSSWDWDFGDGGTSDEQNPLHTYGSEGLYYVNLTIEGDSGDCFSTVEMMVRIGSDTIPEGCQAMFNYYQTPNDANTVYFEDESWGNPTSWAWDFGDGETSEEQDPVHIYGTQGEYFVTLTIASDTCTSTYEEMIWVGLDSIPGCQAMFYDYPGDVPNSVQFMDESWGNPTNWAWDFGDGETSTEQDPLHIYAAEGEYFVNLTISAGDICNSTIEMMVRVGLDSIPEGCQAQFFYFPACDSVPAGDLNYQFIDMSWGEPDGWAWDFGDGGTSDEQDPLHAFAEEGEYEVCLTITKANDTCESTYCEMVYVSYDTIGDCYGWFTYMADDLDVDFEGFMGNSQNGVYTWEFGDGSAGSGQSVSHTYADDGIYLVTMNVVDSVMGCDVEYTEEVWVGDNITFSVYGNVFLEDSMNMADVANVYLMTFDTIGDDLINIATTTIDANGYYEFEEVGFEHCVYFIQAELTDGSAYFGDYVPTYHIDALTWEEAWPVFPFPMGWSYDVYLQPSQTIQSGSGIITGTVNEEESRGMMSNVEILLLNADGSTITYMRTDDNGEFDFSEMAFGTYVVYTEIVGIITTPVTVTLTEENPTATVSIVVTNGEALLGVGEINSRFIDEVSAIYPNPVSENSSVNIEMKESGTVQLTVISQYGQVVFATNQDLPSGFSKIELNTNSLSPGLYIVNVKANDNIATVRKFVKLR